MQWNLSFSTFQSWTLLYCIIWFWHLHANRMYEMTCFPTFQKKSCGHAIDKFEDAVKLKRNQIIQTAMGEEWRGSLRAFSCGPFIDLALLFSFICMSRKTLFSLNVICVLNLCSVTCESWFYYTHSSCFYSIYFKMRKIKKYTLPWSLWNSFCNLVSLLSKNKDLVSSLYL